jgi:hypothetical protein
MRILLNKKINKKKLGLKENNFLSDLFIFVVFFYDVSFVVVFRSSMNNNKI